MFKSKPTITAGRQATGLTTMFSHRALRSQRFGCPTTFTPDETTDLACAPYPVRLASHRLDLGLFWPSRSGFLPVLLLAPFTYDISLDVCRSRGVVSPRPSVSSISTDGGNASMVWISCKPRSICSSISRDWEPLDSVRSSTPGGCFLSMLASIDGPSACPSAWGSSAGSPGDGGSETSMMGYDTSVSLSWKVDVSWSVWDDRERVRYKNEEPCLPLLSDKMYVASSAVSSRTDRACSAVSRGARLVSNWPRESLFRAGK